MSATRFSTSVKLGTWTLPSGNSCDATVNVDPHGGMLVSCAWDTPPPFSPGDEFHYFAVVRPAIMRQVMAYVGRPEARVAVVMMGAC